MAALILIILLGSILVPLNFSREGFESYEYYTEEWEDVGAENLVAGVLADWRAYDTMGEAIVLITAILGFYVILKEDDNDEDV